MQALGSKQDVSRARERQNNLQVAARNELIEGHVDVALKMGRSLLRGWGCRLPTEDVKSVINVALCEAASRFDTKQRVKFSTFLFYYVKGALGVAVSKQIRECRVTRSDAEQNERFTHGPEETLSAKRGLIKLVGTFKGMSETQQQIAQETIFGETPVGEVARKNGEDRCTASRRRTLVAGKLIGAVRNDDSEGAASANRRAA